MSTNITEALNTLELAKATPIPKADEVKAASDAKAARLSELTALAENRLLSQISDGKGGNSVSQIEHDMFALNRVENANKYGGELAAEMESAKGTAARNLQRRFIESNTASTPQVIKDSALGYVAGAGNLALGLTQLHVLGSDIASQGVAKVSEGFNSLIHAGMSPAMQAQMGLKGQVNSLSDRDREDEHQLRLAAGGNETGSKIERAIGQAVDRAAGFGDYGLADSNVVAEAVGSIGAMGYLTKGISKLGSEFATKMLSEGVASKAAK